MSASANPDIVTDGLHGEIDANAYERSNPSSGSAYYLNFLGGASAQRCYAGNAVPRPSSLPRSYEFGSSRSTYLQIPDTSGTFGNSFDFDTDDGYSVDVWVKRTGYGTWTSGTTNYDGIWNYYWVHNLHFSGAHTSVNQIRGTGLSGYNISMDTWYNVVTTHDNSASSNNHNVYIDNSVAQTSQIGNASSTRRFYVGNWDSSWAMVGEVAVIRVYNKALTAKEIAQNYNATKSRFQ